MTSKTLIRGGTVLTLGAKTTNYAEADILIEDGRIAEVGPRLRARDAEQVDATDTIAIPGFVDTHRHAWKSLFRNLGESDPGGNVRIPPGDSLQPDDVYAATLIGLLGAVEAGITCVVDWADVGLDDAHVDAALQAHADSGLRTVCILSAPDSAADDPSAASLRRQASRHAADDRPLATLAVGSVDPVRSNLDQAISEWTLAREFGLRIHAHVGVDEGGAVVDLAGRGALGRDVTFVHCSHLDSASFDAIASHGVSVSLSPAAEMAGGRGVPPIQQLIDLGIRPGLGIDNEQLAPGDMFAQIRATISLQHANLFDLKLAGKAGLPQMMNTREVLRYATVDGATAVGLGSVTGSIEVGKQADLVLLRADRPNIFPINDPIGAVVWGMDTSNVDWVFAAGKALMRQGVLVADVERARDLVGAAQLRMTSPSGRIADGGAGL